MNEEWKDVILRIIVVVILGAAVIGIVLAIRDFGADKEYPKALTTEQVKDPETVSKKVQVSYPEARTIVREIEKSTGSTPQITYYVQSPTAEKVAETTTEMIRKSDPAMPEAVTRKSDRTVVTIDNNKQKVDVYKISLRKAHKIKAGMTYIDSKAYLSTGYQAGRWEGLVHLDSRTLEPKGGTVTYTLLEW